MATQNVAEQGNRFENKYLEADPDADGADAKSKKPGAKQRMHKFLLTDGHI